MSNSGDATRSTVRRAICILAICICSAVQISCSNKPLETTGVGGCDPPSEYTLVPPNTTSQVNQIGQEKDQWCWAASGQMILGYFGQTISQCKQVSDRYPTLGDCCGKKASANCGDQTGWPQFCKHHFDVKIRHGAGLGWDEIKHQVFCQKNPIAFTWRWADGIKGHMMVAFGYGSNGQATTTTNFLWVRNPLPLGAGKTEKIFYSDYLPNKSVPSAGNPTEPPHTHWDDFYDFQTKQDVVCTNDNSE